MSKQDRQGVRKASDIEQKYDLSKLNNLDGFTARQNEQLSKLTQALSQFVVETNNKFANLHPIGTVHISLTNENPSLVYGGTWEMILSGKIVVGADLKQSEDTCYIWKRTS